MHGMREYKSETFHSLPWTVNRSCSSLIELGHRFLYCNGAVPFVNQTNCVRLFVLRSIFCWVLCVTGYLKTNKKQTNFPCVLFPLWRMIQVHNPCMDIWIKDIQKPLKIFFFSGLQCCNVWQMAAPHLLLHLLCRWNCPEPMALLHHVRGLLIIILLSLKLWKHYLKWHHCFWEIQGSRHFCIVSDVCTYLTIACATCYIIMFILWSITITCTEDLHFKTSFWLFWHLHSCFVMCVKCNMFIHSGPWALPGNVCLGALPWPSFSEVMLAQALLAQGIEWYKHWWHVLLDNTYTHIFNLESWVMLTLILWW